MRKIVPVVSLVLGCLTLALLGHEANVKGHDFVFTRFAR
jgi:hypothetical protein